MLWFSDVFRAAYECVQLFTPQLKCLGLLCFFCVPVFALYGFSLSPLYLGCYLKFLVLSVNHNVTSHSHLHHSTPFFTTHILWMRIQVLCLLKSCLKLKDLDGRHQDFALWRKCMGSRFFGCSANVLLTFLFPCCFWIAKTAS